MFISRWVFIRLCEDLVVGNSSLQLNQLTAQHGIVRLVALYPSVRIEPLFSCDEVGCIHILPAYT